MKPTFRYSSVSSRPYFKPKLKKQLMKAGRVQLRVSVRLALLQVKYKKDFEESKGCSDVAEAFRLQEIDGQALLLLTEDHLMTSMNIKLGPALKICAHINSLKNH
ncbi:Polyhomeotic-like protein 3 [Collichthys lucidus]|uniref:Polyhomeotic-like protein 3 n=1 Tax=Collichthys lucidus TaxID=240159 RepID=A0A4U5VGS8_COLLU|nr:Polyhomeotic-like protein 3 [Collichthys lucidus]